MVNKKGEMPWWLVLMILAILFLAVMSYVQGGIIKRSLATIGLVEKQTDDQANCLVIFDKSNDKDGDGWDDNEKCDECPDNPKLHKKVDGSCA